MILRSRTNTSDRVQIRTGAVPKSIIDDCFNSKSSRHNPYPTCEFDLNVYTCMSQQNKNNNNLSLGTLM